MVFKSCYRRILPENPTCDKTGAPATLTCSGSSSLPCGQPASANRTWSGCCRKIPPEPSPGERGSRHEPGDEGDPPVADDGSGGSAAATISSGGSDRPALSGGGDVPAGGCGSSSGGKASP